MSIFAFGFDSFSVFCCRCCCCVVVGINFCANIAVAAFDSVNVSLNLQFYSILSELEFFVCLRFPFKLNSVRQDDARLFCTCHSSPVCVFVDIFFTSHPNVFFEQ